LFNDDNPLEIKDTIMDAQSLAREVENLQTTTNRKGPRSMGFRVVDFQEHGDSRGVLIALEAGRNIPFDIRRVYYIYGTQTDVQRGFHAHHELKQMAIVVKGACKFILDDGIERNTVELNSPSQGLLIEGLIWREMVDFSEDCVLMVLADQHYDERDYIRNYDDFLKAAKR
jgi:dTDP-4-dehydrorhamnose 3,5-epimerase-like enzyme